MNCPGEAQACHRREVSCRLAFRWQMIAPMAVDRALGGSEPRSGGRGTAPALPSVRVDAVLTSVP